MTFIILLECAGSSLHYLTVPGATVPCDGEKISHNNSVNGGAPQSDRSTSRALRFAALTKKKGKEKSIPSNDLGRHSKVNWLQRVQAKFTKGAQTMHDFCTTSAESRGVGRESGLRPGLRLSLVLEPFLGE